MAIKRVFRDWAMICVLSATLLCASCSTKEQQIVRTNLDDTSQSTVTSATPSDESPETKPENKKAAETAEATNGADSRRCSAQDLRFEIKRDQGAAGSVYYALVAKNTGDSTCILEGYPDVAFINQSGKQIGPSAERSGRAFQPISLNSGAETETFLRVGNPGNYEDCQPESIKTVKILPPAQKSAAVASADLKVCSGDFSNVTIDPFGSK